MRRFFYCLSAIFLFLWIALPTKLHAQQAPDQFHWIDLRSDKDRDTIIWVTSSLEPAQWTAIREIGVSWDAALVVTADRPNNQASPGEDTFSVWNVSLSNHGIYPLVKGVNLRWLGWIHFAENMPNEIAILYDNCEHCAANTYFTTFHYTAAIHSWEARWMHSEQGVLLTSNSPAQEVHATQAYALLTELNGHQFLGTWNHIDFGSQKPSQDIVFRYEVDALSQMDRAQPLTGPQADAMKSRICQAQNVPFGLASGQDSTRCALYGGKSRSERRPVTTPPANNHGRSTPPGARR